MMVALSLSVGIRRVRKPTFGVVMEQATIHGGDWREWGITGLEQYVLQTSRVARVITSFSFMSSGLCPRWHE